MYYYPSQGSNNAAEYLGDIEMKMLKSLSRNKDFMIAFKAFGSIFITVLLVRFCESILLGYMYVGASL